MNGRASASQSLRSLRSNRTGNDSLRRSCLLSRSANTSQVQIIAETGQNVEYRNGSQHGHGQSVPQRRCRSLGKFPDDTSRGSGCAESSLKSVSSAGRVSPGNYGSTRNKRQFLCVPQARRKESKSLDLFPTTPSNASDRSDRPVGHSEECVRLLADEQDIVLTIPGGPEAQLRPNGDVEELHEGEEEDVDEEEEDGASERALKRRMSAVCLPDVHDDDDGEDEKKWRSCDALRPVPPSPAGHSGVKRDTKPIASVKQWLVNLFVVRPSEEFSKNHMPSEEHVKIASDDRESVV